MNEFIVMVDKKPAGVFTDFDAACYVILNHEIVYQSGKQYDDFPC